MSGGGERGARGATPADGRAGGGARPSPRRAAGGVAVLLLAVAAVGGTGGAAPARADDPPPVPRPGPVPVPDPPPAPEPPPAPPAPSPPAGGGPPGDAPAAPPAAAGEGDAAATPPADDAAEVAALSGAERAKRLAAALDEVGRALAPVKSLRARFEQRKYLEVFGEEVTSRGRLFLRFPGRLRWEYEEPLRSTLVVNGDVVRRERTSRRGVTTAGTGRLADDPVTAATAEQVFLWTRGDFAAARERYDLELVSTRPLVVRAVPRDATMRRVVDAVELSFDASRTALAAIVLRERTTARTTITFLDVERDADLDDALFDVGGREK